MRENAGFMSRLDVRVSDVLLAEVQQRAELYGCTVSDLVRASLAWCMEHPECQQELQARCGRLRTEDTRTEEQREAFERLVWPDLDLGALFSADHPLLAAPEPGAADR